MDNLLNQSESSTTREKEVSESEEQNDNVSGDEINEEQWTDTLPAQKFIPPRSERSHNSLQASTRKPSRFT